VTAAAHSGRFGRALGVVAAGAIAAAIIGFLTGVRRVPEPAGYQEPMAAVAGEVPVAPTHGELGQRRMGPNRARHPAGLLALGADRPALTDEVMPTEEERRASVASRARNRAYDGAPPTIPHPIEQRGYPSCLSCHGEGMRVFGKTAPVMSHGELGSCTQCHVVERGFLPEGVGALGDVAEGRPPLDNAFVGTRAPGSGERAWEGAPPTIPHPTRMRERCGSCHGVLAEGLRTSHPWRQSCTQCHAPSAGMDGRPVADLPEAW
jgi:nitrate reductase (cytochrome), electron transfer subunit